MLSLSIADARRGGEKEDSERKEQDGSRKMPQPEKGADRYPASGEYLRLDLAGWASYAAAAAAAAFLPPAPFPPEELTDLSLPFCVSAGNRPTGGGEVRAPDRNRQPAQREGKAGIRAGRSPPCLQDPRGVTVLGRAGGLFPGSVSRGARGQLSRVRRGGFRPPAAARADPGRACEGEQWLGVEGRALRRLLHSLRPRDAALCTRHGSVRLLFLLRRGLGAPGGSGHRGSGAPLHSGGDLHALPQHLHLLLRLHLSRDRVFPQLRSGS